MVEIHNRLNPEMINSSILTQFPCHVISQYHLVLNTLGIKRLKKFQSHSLEAHVPQS